MWTYFLLSVNYWIFATKFHQSMAFYCTKNDHKMDYFSSKAPLSKQSPPQIWPFWRVKTITRTRAKLHNGKLGPPVGGVVPVPSKKNGLVPQEQNLDFLCSLFPKIACVPLIFRPLFPWKNCPCSSKSLGGPRKSRWSTYFGSCIVW